MNEPDLSIQIETLKALRLDCAARSQALSERELDGRLLRLHIEAEMVAEGKSATAAEKFAKATDQYVAWERETARLFFERERVLAEAEAMLLNVKLQMLVLERTV